MGKFEENWKDIFEGAEASPSDSVWANIDRDLANAEGATMKKRMVLYQRIAAASLLFALLAGSFGVYRWRQGNAQLASRESLENKLSSEQKESKITDNKLSETKSTATNDNGLNTLNQKKEPNENNLVSTTKTSDERKNNSQTSIKEKTIASSTKNKNLEKEELTDQKIKPSTQAIQNSPPVISSNENTIAASNENTTTEKEQLTKSNSLPINTVFQNAQANKKTETGIATKKYFFEREISPMPGLDRLPIPGVEGGPVLTEIFRKLPAISGAFMAHTERKVVHEQMWASVTAASGSFTTASSPFSNYSYATAGQNASSANSSSSVGSAVSVGMLGGIRVASRVVLQSGVQYMNQSTNSTTNISSPNSLAAVAKSYTGNPASYTISSPYALTSANEFVSVPVQAGYLFIDKRMGLQLNSGVSADFFIRNTLSDPSGQRQSYSQSSGQDSPYRAVNFSGLMSSEVSYKLGNRYRVSLVPGIRYSFNPILKSTTSSAGNPLLWDVGFRFRYIFK